MNKRGLRVHRVVFLGTIFVGILILIFMVVPLLQHQIHPTKYINATADTLTIHVPYFNNGEADEKKMTLPRGAKVRVDEIGEQESVIEYNKEKISVKNKYLVDSLEDCLQIDKIYPRRLIHLRDKKDGKLTSKVLKKGESAKVVHIDSEDLNPNTGAIKWYEIKKDGKNYWIRGDCVETSEKMAQKNYAQNIIYSTYWDAYYGDGYSKEAYINQIDYKPRKKQQYKNNPLPKDVNAIHTTLENLIKYKDYFLNLHKTTSINGIVIELKGDNGQLAYQSKVTKDYLSNPKEATEHSVATLPELKQLIQEFKEEGYYTIGRIVTFKDELFAIQNPKEAITDFQNHPIVHNNEYWPSAFSRKAWMYNVDIAKEIADCGINEIQFDYVRFPDGLSSIDSEVNLHNKYKESRTSTLQGFLIYAKEELEPYKVYVAADVFAWPIVAQDDQDIGQFLPAITNVVDVVCPMPYTDHFSQGSMGIENPSLAPEETLYQFSKIYKKESDAIQNAAQYRTWIQGYDFESKDIKEQIRGINKAGYQGYMVWYGGGNKDSFQYIEKGLIDSKINN